MTPDNSQDQLNGDTASGEINTKALLQRIADAARCAIHAQTALVSVPTDRHDTLMVSSQQNPDEQRDLQALIDALEGARAPRDNGRPATLVVGDLSQETDERLVAAMREFGLGAVVSVPILSADVRVGTLSVGDAQPREWLDTDVQALNELAGLATLPIDRAVHMPENDDRDRALAQLRRSFDDGLAGHAVASPSGRILACNPEFARITGFETVADAIAANLRELEPVPGAFNSMLERLEQTPLIPFEELSFVRRNGQPSQVLARVAATLDAQGEVTEIRAYLVDITQHFLLEQESRESAERLRLLELATQDVLWDWNLATGRLSWNKAIARRFRYNPAEVRASIDWHVECIHPEDRDRVISGIERAILGVENFWTDEYRFLRGDGTYASIMDRAYIVRNGRGEPERIVGWILDITERKAREDSLRFLARAGASLESALEVEAIASKLARLGVPTLAEVCLIDVLENGGSLRRLAVAHVDPSLEHHLGLGTVIGNGSEAAGAPLTAVRSGAPDFLAASDFDASHHLGIAKEAGVRAYMVVPIAARDHVLGAATFGFSDTRRHFDPYDLMTAKELALLAGQAMDNAVLYDTERRAVLTRNEVLGTVSHDLRAPVNTMMATLSILSDSMRERREEVRKWFDMAYRATEQMKAMIEDLLDTSRIESHQFTVDRVEGSAQAIIEEACDMLRPLADSKGIAINADVADDLPSLSVDAPQIVRVLGNLIGNAIKFSHEGGNITVQARAHDGALRISVADQGDGIPEDQRAHVFDRFWTGRGGDRRGAGLGLAIAKGIVEAHGGQIWVERAEERGSIFTFSLPICNDVGDCPPPKAR